MDIKDRIAELAMEEGIDFSTAASILGQRGAAALKKKRKRQPTKEETQAIDEWLKDEYYKPFTHNPDKR